MKSKLTSRLLLIAALGAGAGNLLGIPMNDLRTASEKIQPVMEQAEELAVQGKPEEGNQMILRVFHGDKATAVEKLVLGNVFYKQAPALSYSLHQAAAAASRPSRGP